MHSITSTSGDISPQPKRGAQSISRAIGLLRYIAKHNDRGVRLSEISKISGLTLSTTHRILNVLSTEGLISHYPGSKLYHLGIELYHLGGKARQYTIREYYRRCLERISQETDDTAFLLIRAGYDALCIDRVEGSYPIKAVLIDIGSRRPLGIGVASLSLIAFLPEKDCEAAISANSSRYSQFNMNAAAIRTLARKARQSGCAVSKGLFHRGVMSIGIPIINDQGEVPAAIAVSAISKRMNSGRRDRIYNLVRRIINEERIISQSSKG